MRMCVSGLLAGVFTLALGACGPGGSSERQAAEADTGPVRVLTTFYPTTYFAQRISGGLTGGDLEIVCPVPEGEDPIFWQPTAEQVGEYQRADLIVLNGAGFERWAANAALPSSRVVDTAEGFAAEFIMIESKTHSHGAAGAHTHEGLDGHTWLDPTNAVRQARVIGEALADAHPEHGEQILANYEDLERDLQTLDAEFRTLPIDGVRLLASHPAYNYLSRRYNWGVTSFDLDPGEAVTAEQLAGIEAAKQTPAGGRTVMLWESEPIESSIAALESVGITSVVFSPAETVDPARLAAGEDYLSIMQANIERVRDALRP